MSESAPPAAVPATAPENDASKAMTLFVAVVATLYFGREVLVPVTLALLLAFILAPLVNLLRRLRIGRVPSVLLGVVLALAVVLAVGGVIGEQIADLSADLPKYVHTIETKVANVRHYTLDRVTRLAASVGAHGGGVGEKSPPSGAPASAPSPAAPASAQPAQAPASTSEAGSSPLQLASRYLEPVLSPIATLGIVFVVAIFALLQREDLRDRLIRLIGSDDLHRTTLAIDDGGRRLSRYFLTQLSVNASFGVVIGLGLLVIGVPDPVLWGILSCLLRFVPYVGSFIAAALPMALAAAVEPGWGTVLWTAALYVVVEGITGQAIEPLLYGHSTGLSPFSVIVAAIFWSWLWGPIGLILSTPLTLCLVVMGRHVKRLEFLDVMLGDRPALTPVETFYQRILAGDADEALDHAEQLLKTISLSSYYDEVALKGLQLAANDAERGTLDAHALDRIRSTVRALVAGLAEHQDEAPENDDEAERRREEEDGPVTRSDGPPIPSHPVQAKLASADLPSGWGGPSAVLCIAGRGPLDEAASAMLAQLLAKHGIGARLVGYREVSREGIDGLGVDGVAMACVSYLDLRGAPAHLRYLVQRLRRQLPPDSPVLVGLWPAGDAAMTDRNIQTTLGANYFTSSLEQAVAACIEATRGTNDRRSVA